MRLRHASRGMALAPVRTHQDRFLLGASTYATKVVLVTLVGALACTAEIKNDASGGSSTRGPNTSPVDGRNVADKQPNTRESAPPRCPTVRADASEARLVRLTAPQYEAHISDLLKSTEAATTNPFVHDNLTGRFSRARDLGMPQLVVDQLITHSEEVAQKLVAKYKVLRPCTTLSPISLECTRDTLTEIATKAFRRRVSPEEVAPFVTAVSEATSTLGTTRALELGVAGILLSPRTVFNWERGEDQADVNNRHRLTSHEIVSLLAFAITDSPPDETMLAAAAQDGLMARDSLKNMMAPLWERQRARDKFVRFVRELFRFDGAVHVFKDPQRYPHHDAEALIQDTNAFVARIFTGRTDSIARLLAAPDGIASPATASSYGVTLSGTGQQPVAFPPGERYGLLTQPSWLSATSTNEENDPIARGHFVREMLLCQHIPEIPIGVVPVLPEQGPDATLRDRLQVHSQGSCKGCHDLMDPIGLVFEGYDHTGRVRKEERGRPVDTSGAILSGPTGDVPLSGPGDLARFLSTTPEVAKCFMRQALQFYLARDSTEVDDCAIDEALSAMSAQGGDIVAGLTSLLSSDLVMYRLWQESSL